jgi:hypothetical protein
MKKLAFLILILLCLGWAVSCPSQREEEREDTESTLSPEVDLKNLIERAEMKTYRDADYDVEVCYPDFFVVCDTAEDGTARFYYPNENKKEISLIMFVEPNIEGWNIHEAVENLSDSMNICLEEGEDYFIFSSQSIGTRMCILEKCFLIDDQWIDYTLYYHLKYSNDIGRLVDMVKEWNPRTNAAPKEKTNE